MNLTYSMPNKCCFEIGWRPPFTLIGTYITGYNINVTKGGELMNTTNVDNTTTEWLYCPNKFGEHSVSISAVNNVGEGDIMMLKIPFDKCK